MDDVIDRIPVQRNVAVVRPSSIVVRPARGQALGPLIELGIAGGALLLVVLFLDSLPLAALTALVLAAVLLAPIGVVSLVNGLIGRSVVIAPSPNATTPMRIELGCRSTKAVAASFAASMRDGSRSSARMLFETSNARMTVPSRCGSPKLIVGRASEKQMRPTAAANSAKGTCRRQRTRRSGAVATSPSDASRAARSARSRTAHV